MIPFAEEYYRKLRYEADPVAGFRLRPNQRLPHITINAYGFRGIPFTGSEKVLILGDSATFGVGASSDEARFSRFFEQATGIATADASLRAYRVFQHFARLPSVLARVAQVRYVFLWCGYVDLFYWVTSGGQLDGAFTLDQIHGIGRWLRALRRRFSKLLAASPRRATPLHPLSDLVDSMMGYIQASRDLLEARGITFVLLIQPFLREEPHTQHLKILMDRMNERVRRKLGQDWNRLSCAFLAALRRRLEQEGNIRWLDCQDFVTEADFLDSVHLKESAMAKIANALAQTLSVREHLGVVPKEEGLLTVKGGES